MSDDASPSLDAAGELLPVETDAPLSAQEAERLRILERKIRRGRAAFRAMVFALLEVRDRRLFRTTHPSMAAYAIDVLDIGERHFRRLVAAAKIISDCERNGLQAPANEAQARAMIQASARRDLASAAQEQDRKPRACRTELPDAQELARQRPGLAKTEHIALAVAELRALTDGHPWQCRGEALIDLYEATILPWPAAGFEQ